LVEAAGIEPASESATLRFLHACFAYLISDNEPPANGLKHHPISLYLISGSGETPKTSLLPSLHPKHRQSQSSVPLLIKQQEPVRCWRLCFSPSFNVVMEPRHAA